MVKVGDLVRIRGDINAPLMVVEKITLFGNVWCRYYNPTDMFHARAVFKSSLALIPQFR